MSKPIGIFFCALIFLAGCATLPKEPEEAISSPAPHLGNEKLNWIDPDTVRPQVAPPVVKPAVSTVKVNSPPPVIHQPTAIEPVMAMTSLDRWAAQKKINPPHFLSSTPLLTYSVSSTNGVMIVAIGSRRVTWNGIQLQLGFEPQMVDGEIFVHGLDLQKNLEPLLCALPLTLGTNRVIVIDPGHGGNKGGTLSVLDNRPEKEFTLDWAKRLKPLLEQQGWQVYLTRTNDTDVSLYNRAASAEAHHADLFISLHFNSAAPDTYQSGLETYCLTPTWMRSSMTRGYDDTVSLNFSGNQFDTQNLQLAVRLHIALLHATGEEDRSVRRARFMDVLHEHNHPAILIEGGYLSNPREAKRIEDPAFRQKLAEAVASALK